MKKVETAVLSRIHSIEFPFFSGYLAHYLDRLGFDRVFLIHGEKTDPAPLQARIERQGFADRVEIVQPASHQHAEALFAGLMPMLRSRCEWLLLNDLDEYVYLGGKTVQDYIARHPAYRVLHFRQIMIASAREAPSSYADTFDKASMFPKWMTKTLFRTADVVDMTAHIPIGRRPIPSSKELIPEIEPPVADSVFQFHFVSRGMRDILLRSIRQNFPSANVKATDMATLKRYLERRGDVKTLAEVPGRFAVMMVQMMENQAARPRMISVARIGAETMGRTRFNNALLNRMLDKALGSIGIEGKTRRRILEGKLLSTSLERTIDRFWTDAARADLNRLNYVKVIKGMRGEAY
ncbi:MAG: hypothetical protein WD711_00875 [Dongiaceae bacterium]